MSMLHKKILTGLWLMGVFVNVAFALQPGFNVQGRLTDAAGNPKSGLFALTFSIYAEEAGGVPIWGKAIPTEVVNGNFQALLYGVGDAAWPALENAVKDLSGAYVEVKVGSETAMTPRLPLVRSAFSSTNTVISNGDITIQSDRLGTGVGSVAIKTGENERITVLNNGNIGIGTNSPEAKLTVNGGVKIVDGTEGDGKVLTSDAVGNASWKPVSGSSGGAVYVVSDIHEDETTEEITNVGDGTSFCANNSGVTVATVSATLKGGRPLVINAFASLYLVGTPKTGMTDVRFPMVFMYIKKDGIEVSPKYNSFSANAITPYLTIRTMASFFYSEAASQEGSHIYELVLYPVEADCRYTDAYYATRGLVLTEY